MLNALGHRLRTSERRGRRRQAYLDPVQQLGVVRQGLL